jgi:preprotein translocase subunit SecF
MLELVPHGLNIDFIGKAKFCIPLSILIILIGLGSIIMHGGFNQGIDFSGGTLLQLRFTAPADLGRIREALSTLGLERGIVQHYGNDHEVLIRVAQVETTKDSGPQILQAIQNHFPSQQIELRRTEVVGGQVSTELRRQALFALFYAILGTAVYLSSRFEAKLLVPLVLAVILFVVFYSVTQWFPGISPAILIVLALVVTTIFMIVLQLRYALAAVTAIYHDVLVTVGFLSLFNKEFDLQIIAALLTIIGYSLNDTIVIFDRIRENVQGQRREQFPVIVNTSVNQTLSRTVLTTGHTLLVVLAILILGGEVLHDFAFALLVGMIAGTYSTVYIASAILVYWHNYSARTRAGAITIGEARPSRT